MLAPYIAFRVAAFHFLEKHIPHLVVAAQILDLMDQFIFSHEEFLLFVR